VWGLGTLASNF